MSRRVLIVPDKFKGTLTAAEAAEAIASGWRRACPGDVIELLPMSDGGDGFGSILATPLGAETRSVSTSDAAGRPVSAEWWWDPRGRIAVIEAARANGLAQLPPGRFHPFDLDTHGIAALFEAAAKAGAQRCLVGIGGSATNDAGFGLARGLGWGFLDRDGDPIERWTALDRLDHVSPPPESVRVRFPELLVAVDVQNPLLGPQGCSRIYGPQKGIRPDDLPVADAALGRLAEVMARQLGQDFASTPGAGAAGGLGFGLCAFLGGRMTPGFDLFAELTQLAAKVEAADLVITAEGSIDASSLMGKGVGGVADCCARRGRPCLGLAGVLGSPELLAGRFQALRGLTPDFVSREEAFARPAHHLARLAETLAVGYGGVAGGA